VAFATILVRQGHPGPDAGPYRTLAQKERDARRHQREDAVPWPVLVDDLEGQVHRAYGMLADPTFLVDREGRIAFYNAVTHAPTLHRALEQLFLQDGRGVVLDGADRRPHLLAPIVGGWPALARGLPQSAIDLETALPSSALLPFLGHQLRGILTPVALGARPLSRGTRATLAVAALAGMAALGAAVLTTSAPSARRDRTAGPQPLEPAALPGS
jgi:hypothetical protein